MSPSGFQMLSSGHNGRWGLSSVFNNKTNTGGPSTKEDGDAKLKKPGSLRL